MEFSVDYPPSVNNYWRRSQHGGMHLTKEARSYKQTVKGQLKAAKVGKLTGKIKGVFKVYPPDNRRRDLDNVMKALLDAMEGIAFDDDYQLHVMVIERAQALKGGRVDIVLCEIE